MTRRIFSLAFLFGVVSAAFAGLTSDIKIDRLEADKTAVVLSCQPGMRIPAECGTDPTVRIKALLSGADAASKAQLETVVSGGRVKAIAAAEFAWDLSGVAAGEYTITVMARGTDDKIADSKKILVSVKKCSACVYADSCPVLSVTGPSDMVEPGETIAFTANLSGGADSSVTYNWTVSAGTIVSGQGTPKIEVATGSDLAGISVTATVSLSGQNWFMACATSASETASIRPRPAPRLVDEFKTRGSNCEEGFARLDSFLNELNNDPSAQGVVAVYGETDEPRAARRRRKQLENFLKFRRFDRDRIAFIYGRALAGGTTQFWLVPAGAETPEITPPEISAATAPEIAPKGPYLFGADYADGVAGCGSGIYDLGEYAAVLRSEPGTRGRIIISQSTRALFNEKAREVLAELARHGVPRRRLVVIFKRVRRNSLAESTELWVIPPPVRRRPQ